MQLHLLAFSVSVALAQNDGANAQRVADCFNEAYSTASVVSSFTSPVYQVTCSPAHIGHPAESKAQIFTYRPGANYRVLADGLIHIEISNNDGSVSNPETTPDGGARFILTCQGGGLTGGRGWMHAKITGKRQYMPPRAEQESMVRTCKTHIFGGG